MKFGCFHRSIIAVGKSLAAWAAYENHDKGGQGQNRTADTGIFSQWDPPGIIETIEVLLYKPCPYVKHVDQGER